MINTKLDIGAGAYGCGDINLDIAKHPGVNCVADAFKPLPFKNEYFDYVYASHILEHDWEDHIEESLKEWVRVLKIGGIFEIKVPNIKSIPIFAQFYLDLMGLGLIYGDKTGHKHHMLHKMAFSIPLLEKLLYKHNIIITKCKPFYEQEVYEHDIQCNKVTRVYPLLSREIHFWGIKVKDKNMYKLNYQDDQYLDGVQMFINLVKGK